MTQTVRLLRPTVLFGLRRCDTCLRARAWLDEHDIEYTFHELRADGITSGMIAGWASDVGWEKLLNRQSSTWRKIPEADRADLTEARAVALMLDHPTLIQRPVLETGGRAYTRFVPSIYAKIFAND